jgi:hypothetical protein
LRNRRQVGRQTEQPRRLLAFEPLDVGSRLTTGSEAIGIVQHPLQPVAAAQTLHQA